MTKRNQAFLAIILCVFFWGFSFVSIKVAVQVFPPMTLGAARFLLAVLFLFFVKRISVPDEKPEKRDFPYLIGAGLVGVTLYFFFENNGVALVTASEASIIVAAIPVLTMAAEWLWSRIRTRRAKRLGTELKDGSGGPLRITGRRWAGAAVSVIGVWLVVGVSLSVSGNIKGYLYMFGAAASWVAYCFLTRPLFSRRSRVCIVFWQSVFGFLGFLPFAAAEVPRWGRPDAAVLLHVLFLGICCSALGYWLYAHALEVLGVSAATIFVNLVPVITVIAGFILLGDRLSPLQWAGAVLVVGGVYLAMLEGRPREPFPTSQG
ncbi:DMT family transporter, partial [Treponema sp. OttesenSCG-928-L16]|nr:DMT family transporter [Treponema sp. OttesenSCG-928-L16]